MVAILSREGELMLHSYDPAENPGHHFWSYAKASTDHFIVCRWKWKQNEISNEIELWQGNY